MILTKTFFATHIKLSNRRRLLKKITLIRVQVLHVAKMPSVEWMETVTHAIVCPISSVKLQIVDLSV